VQGLRPRAPVRGYPPPNPRARGGAPCTPHTIQEYTKTAIQDTKQHKYTRTRHTGHAQESTGTQDTGRHARNALRHGDKGTYARQMQARQQHKIRKHGSGRNTHTRVQRRGTLENTACGRTQHNSSNAKRSRGAILGAQARKKHARKNMKERTSQHAHP
jgi:hypothetical protein